MEIFRQITANNIELKEYPFLKELAMEAYLMENEDILKLDTENFAEVNVLDAEIALKLGRKSMNRDGRIDILAKYGLEYLAIVELKTSEINDLTLNQLEDYLTVREQLIQQHQEFWNEVDSAPKWIGVLVGTSISPELQRKLQDGYVSEQDIPIAGMILRRFRGPNNEIFVITDTFFKFQYTSRDFSKFRFNGKTFNKARLVNKVVRTYVEQNPTIGFAQLESVFPQRLQGSSGVFETQSKAQEIFDRTGHKRHYLNPDELVSIADAIIATSNQWGINNITEFINHVNSKIDGFNIENV